MHLITLLLKMGAPFLNLSYVVYFTDPSFEQTTKTSFLSDRELKLLVLEVCYILLLLESSVRFSTKLI